METTPNLDLPYIMPAQAQKHVTHNEALRALDAIVQLAVLDRDLTAPPSEPAAGDRHIVAPGGTGPWSAQDGRIAAFQDGGWAFYQPGEGWVAWVADEGRLVAWDGAAWVATAGEVNPTPLVGINATADATNRLALGSPASLFSHEGAGHQLKVNKAGESDSASLLYQTGFSGRAEMGLTGDDDFHVKVSADGTAWKEALVVDKDEARLGVGTGPLQARVHCRVAAADAGRAFLMTGQGRTGTDDPTHGAVLVLSHNVTGNRQFFLGNSENGNGIRIIGTAIDGFNYLANDRRGLVLGAPDPDGTDVTARRHLFANGHFRAGQWAGVGSYTVATLPSASAAAAGAIVFVSDEAGGAVLAFSDGANWRRVTDRAVVS